MGHVKGQRFKNMPKEINYSSHTKEDSAFRIGGWPIFKFQYFFKRMSDNLIKEDDYDTRQPWLFLLKTLKTNLFNVDFQPITKYHNFLNTPFLESEFFKFGFNSQS